MVSVVAHLSICVLPLAPVKKTWRVFDAVMMLLPAMQMEAKEPRPYRASRLPCPLQSCAAAFPYLLV